MRSDGKIWPLQLVFVLTLIGAAIGLLEPQLFSSGSAPKETIPIILLAVAVAAALVLYFTRFQEAAAIGDPNNPQPGTLLRLVTTLTEQIGTVANPQPGTLLARIGTVGNPEEGTLLARMGNLQTLTAALGTPNNPQPGTLLARIGSVGNPEEGTLLARIGTLERSWRNQGPRP